MQKRRMFDPKMLDKMAGVENTEPKNAVPENGKMENARLCRTWKMKKDDVSEVHYHKFYYYYSVHTLYYKHV